MVVYRHISQLVTNQGLITKQGRRPVEADLHIITDGCLVTEKDKVVFVGDEQSIKGSQFADLPYTDCTGLLITPGLIDCHTHCWYAGDRSGDFQKRLSGQSYADIAAGGGGIRRTVDQTRKATLGELVTLTQERLRYLGSQGITTIEVKFSYCLDDRDLNHLTSAWDKFKDLVRMIPTWMQAHDQAPEHASWDAAIASALSRARELPKSIPHLSADIFVDDGYFNLNHAEQLLKACQSRGIPMRVHGDELADLGVAQWAATNGLMSVDHLLKVNTKGIECLGRSSTVAVLLPGTALSLNAPMAPGRDLIDAGAIVAIASDHNPGSCPLMDIKTIATLGAISMRLSLAEIFAGLTYNSAQALGLHNQVGAIAPGYDADIVAWKTDSLADLFYRPDSVKPKWIRRAIFSS